MEFSHYPQEIKDLTDHVLESRYSNIEFSRECCRRLIGIGESEEDFYLLGFAYYYLAEGFFSRNDYNQFVNFLTEGIKNQQRSHQWSLLARSYNMMGVNAYMRGNDTLCLEHYLTALRHCRDYEFDYEKAIVLANIGHLYLRQKEYEEALKYFSKSRILFQANMDNAFASLNLLQLDIIMGRCYLLLGDIVHAQENDELIKINENVVENGDYNLISVYCFRAVLKHELSEEKERDMYIEKILSGLTKSVPILDICEEILQICSFLLRISRFLELETILYAMQEPLKDMSISQVDMDIRRIWIRYYKKTGCHEKYLEACAQLYELEECYAEENISIVRKATELRFHLERAREKEARLLKEKLDLIKKSETDALTKLPNRYKLNDYMEYIFEKALREQKTLGVEMLDIDYFKQYNDTYGHQEGDKCIKQVADCLCCLADREDVFCARYGGDEFIIIYYGKTDEEILKIASDLRKEIRWLEIKHKNSEVAEHVTITQGIRNTVPHELNKIWDYLFSADTALYEMKKTRRNGIYLVHRMTAEGQNTVILQDEEGEGN